LANTPGLIDLKARRGLAVSDVAMSRSTSSTPGDTAVRAAADRILTENRTMTIATLRPDGWPQATVVGFVNEDLTLYCSVARTSQKLSNIQRDPRASIAIGRRVGRGARIRGLSMAAQVEEVTDPDEIAWVHQLLWERFPDTAVFAPRQEPAAVLRATPQVISITDSSVGRGVPLIFGAREFPTPWRAVQPIARPRPPE
jgi:hypothetical protein